MNQRQIIDVLRNAGVPAAYVRRALKRKNRFGKSFFISRGKIQEFLEYSPRRNNLKVIKALQAIHMPLSIKQQAILLMNLKKFK